MFFLHVSFLNEVSVASNLSRYPVELPVLLLYISLQSLFYCIVRCDPRKVNYHENARLLIWFLIKLYLFPRALLLCMGLRHLLWNR